MKLYKFEPKTLTYKKIPWFRKWIVFSILIIGLFITLKVTEKTYHYYFESENFLLVDYDNDFSEIKLVEKIKELNFKFPWIVLAQAQRETGHYKSPIFFENHNLFGMKEAKLRINLALGTQRGHAYYNDWIESVYDYAFYSSTYYSKCKTEEQYYQLLGYSYAESETYVQDLKNMVARGKLKELFLN